MPTSVPALKSAVGRDLGPFDGHVTVRPGSPFLPAFLGESEDVFRTSANDDEMAPVAQKCRRHDRGKRR